MSEQNIVKAVLDAINRSGLAKVWRNQSGIVRTRGGFMHLAPKGSPDIVGYMLDGSARFVGIEVKKPKKDGGHTNAEQVDAQAKWRDELIKAGAVWMQVTSADEALAVLRGKVAA